MHVFLFDNLIDIALRSLMLIFFFDAIISLSRDTFKSIRN